MAVTELDHILEVHRRDRRRAEALFDLASLGVVLLVGAVLWAFGVVP